MLGFFRLLLAMLHSKVLKFFESICELYNFPFCQLYFESLNQLRSFQWFGSFLISFRAIFKTNFEVSQRIRLNRGFFWSEIRILKPTKSLCEIKLLPWFCSVIYYFNKCCSKCYPLFFKQWQIQFSFSLLTSIEISQILIYCSTYFEIFGLGFVRHWLKMWI